jgi:hypothetical protein
MKKPRKPSKSHGHSAMQSLAAKEAQGHMLQQALAAQQAGPGQSIGMPPQAAPMAGAPMMGPPGMKKGGRVKC